MDMDVFDIELNKNTYDEYLKQLVTLQTMLYLQVVFEKLRPQVLMNKYQFDGVFLTTGKTYDYKIYLKD
jgi:hypothetical protein